MESLLIALFVAAAVWVLMRHGRRLRARRAQARFAAAESSGTMPRVGVPGTVSAEQLERMKALEFEPAAHWSREEADLILDAVAYLRAVLVAARGEASPPVELQNRLLVFILGDAELRAAVSAWGEARRAGGAEVPVARDARFERVAAEARLPGAPAR